MKASELRIGNYARWTQTKSEFEINAGDILSLTLKVNEPSIEGIPLTEEWLLKFGFNSKTEYGNVNFNYWNKQKDCSVDVEPNIAHNKIEVLFYYRVHEQKRRKAILYVHQLQNLYFALTEEELNINYKNLK